MNKVNYNNEKQRCANTRRVNTKRTLNKRCFSPFLPLIIANFARQCVIRNSYSSPSLTHTRKTRLQVQTTKPQLLQNLYSRTVMCGYISSDHLNI